ncbi:hypothetical protein HDU86_001521 [Geranomyces michiganensis]|nr:hypothetical protein HDU86_001521 [Geranomyces michiganensis]
MDTVTTVHVLEKRLEREKKDLLRAVADGFTNERVLKSNSFERVPLSRIKTWMRSSYAKTFISENAGVKKVFEDEAARRKSATKRQKLEDALHPYDANLVQPDAPLKRSTGPRLNNPTFQAESNAAPGNVTGKIVRGSEDKIVTASEDKIVIASENESATASKDKNATAFEDESATASEDESATASEDESATASEDDDHQTGSSGTTLPAYEAGPSVEAAPVVQKARKTRSDKGKTRTAA